MERKEKDMFIEHYCKKCNNTFFLLSEECKLNAEEGKYITCPYDARHGERDVIVRSKYLTLKEYKELMEDKDTYKRKNRRIVNRSYKKL